MVRGLATDGEEDRNVWRDVRWEIRDEEALLNIYKPIWLEDAEDLIYYSGEDGFKDLTREEVVDLSTR